MYADKLSMGRTGLGSTLFPTWTGQWSNLAQRLGAGFKNPESKMANGCIADYARHFLLPPGDFEPEKKRGFAVNVVDDWFFNPRLRAACWRCCETKNR